MADQKSDKVEEDVLHWLRKVDLDHLVTITEELQVTIPQEQLGNKLFLIKRIVRYLHSDVVEKLDDQGTSIFLKLHDDLKTILGDSPAIKVEEVGKNSNPTGSLEDKSVVQLHRLRDFKINGTVGGLDQKDTLSYTSLSFQIAQGKKAGYTFEEIKAAVIKAIKPTSSLRNYLEGRVNMEEKAFIQILRSHYKEQDSAAVFHEMANCVQMSTESELEFCLRAMSMRQRVISLSREEECPFDENLVKKRFFQALFTGLKHNNIRFELQTILKAGTISDEDLLQEVSYTSSIEAERINKFKIKSGVNEVSKTMISKDKSSEAKENENKKKENSIFVEISKLTAKVNELASVRDEIRDVKKHLESGNFETNKKSGETRHRQRRIFRCKGCEGVNSNYCNHCFLCGESDHRRNQCPQLNQKN